MLLAPHKSPRPAGRGREPACCVESPAVVRLRGKGGGRIHHDAGSDRCGSLLRWQGVRCAGSTQGDVGRRALKFEDLYYEEFTTATYQELNRVGEWFNRLFGYHPVLVGGWAVFHY